MLLVQLDICMPDLHLVVLPFIDVVVVFVLVVGIEEVGRGGGGGGGVRGHLVGLDK